MDNKVYEEESYEEDVDEIDEIDVLKERVIYLEDQLKEKTQNLIASNEKVRNLQLSEFRLEEDIIFLTNQNNDTNEESVKPVFHLMS